MYITNPETNPGLIPLYNENELLQRTLQLAGKRVLELGCGRAEKTRALAAAGEVLEVVAMEVDAIQHAKNLAQPQERVVFCHGGAEAIPAPDNSFDVVLMFKSLHHVPMPVMEQALSEIRRVLKPGGYAWLSEPVYQGDFNDILRLFHDEKIVREAAFAAISRAVAAGQLTLVQQLFFNTSGRFNSFAEFEERILKVTHTNHQLSPELYAEVKAKFMAHMTENGAKFLNPVRVDWLQKN